MKLVKDILLIDFETTDIDPLKAKPVQLAAVLLDKSDLQEKANFATFIKQDLSDANPQALAINGITEKHLESAPSQDEVIKKFIEKFGSNIMLCSWVQFLDRAMLFKMLADAKLDYRIYDYYHYLDLWPVSYIYLAKQGYAGEINSESMFKAFGLASRKQHDALEDCRMAAEILRKILST